MILNHVGFCWALLSTWIETFNTRWDMLKNLCELILSFGRNLMIDWQSAKQQNSNLGLCFGGFGNFFQNPGSFFVSPEHLLVNKLAPRRVDQHRHPLFFFRLLVSIEIKMTPRKKKIWREKCETAFWTTLAFHHLLRFWGTAEIWFVAEWCRQRKS